MSKQENDLLSSGLTAREVEESRAKHGANELTPPVRPSMWRLYLEKFQDPVIRILLVAALLSFIVAFVEQDFAETIGIVCAILLATGIGFYFEYDAAKKFDVLNALGSESMVRVVRDGSVVEVPRKELVVGDVILLDTGDEVPADAELLQAETLQINESNLTGEPVVRKSTNPKDFDEKAPYATNHLMRSTTIVEGRAVARVLWPSVTVWDKAAYFEVFKIVLHNFMMAVTLIVMAVPEGLPMAVTLSLALNMRRMLKTNNLVRKMHACETMGAITVICTDKTGTLTQNKMTVSEMVENGTETARLEESLACNTTAFLNEERIQGLGNPTEVALLLWLQARGKDYMSLRGGAPEIVRLPFSSERKMMATVVDSAVCGRRVMYVKGAPEIVLNLCEGLTDVERAAYQERLKDWQMHAQRTLAMAYKVISVTEHTDCEALLQAGGLTLLGVAAISDPVREEVPPAVKSCLKAGVKIKVVTGDSSGTAIEIARQIGLWNENDNERNYMRGADFAALSDEEALERIKDLKVMSRARPLDKQRLVRLLQQQDEVVAVTGDGTNDAPALNFAQVGLSMGSGTSVAKEASDITLLDDSFRSIVTAVMWGRSLYKNIQRFVMFQLTINFTALLTVLIGAFIGTTLPLTVTQMLWVNIIMDTFAALALASLPADPAVMNERPRPVSQFIITRPIWGGILGYGSAFVIAMLAMMLYFGGGTELTINELTIYFTFFVMLQFWNLLNAKAYSSHKSAFSGLTHCYGVLMVLVFILVGQWLIVQFGGRVFRTAPLSCNDWLLVIAASSLVLWVGELLRAVQRIRHKA